MFDVIKNDRNDEQFQIGNTERKNTFKLRNCNNMTFFNLPTSKYKIKIVLKRIVLHNSKQSLKT